ncbi:MAG: energy transducer TonB [Comamonadaceae bacterium]|nr:MAG: energy transducer TonB [Comamonadaceae bacterium]
MHAVLFAGWPDWLRPKAAIVSGNAPIQARLMQGSPDMLQAIPSRTPESRTAPAASPVAAPEPVPVPEARPTPPQAAAPASTTAAPASLAPTPARTPTTASEPVPATRLPAENSPPRPVNRSAAALPSATAVGPEVAPGPAPAPAPGATAASAGQPEGPSFRTGAELDPGSVVLRLMIDPQGEVEDIVVLRSNPPGLFDASAVAAFGRARFSPGRFMGLPVRSQITFAVDYAPTNRGSAVSGRGTDTSTTRQ